MKFNINMPDILHKKLKILSVYKGKTLNALTVDIYKKIITEWEAEHGEIVIPAEKS